MTASDTLDGEPPLVIGHRGASAYLPEHTLEAYRLAIQLGADVIEPDVVPTKDGHLIARHENELGGTTDVSTRPEFADRRTTKVIDGTEVSGWFSEDFTLAEIKTLYAKERIPEIRPGNTAYDGQFRVPTIEEVVALVREEEARTGRQIGIIPETKHPVFFEYEGRFLDGDRIDMDTSRMLVEALEQTADHLGRP
jgi:glycerophosphoryl diester phosphodiesterase